MKHFKKFIKAMNGYERQERFGDLPAINTNKHSLWAMGRIFQTHFEKFKTINHEKQYFMIIDYFPDEFFNAINWIDIDELIWKQELDDRSVSYTYTFELCSLLFQELSKLGTEKLEYLIDLTTNMEAEYFDKLSVEGIRTLKEVLTSALKQEA